MAIVVSFLFAGTAAQAQVNSGSDGSDGAFTPTMDTVISMADHPNGIYQYTSVSISAGVHVSFIPNAANTPVALLGGPGLHVLSEGKQFNILQDGPQPA